MADEPKDLHFDSWQNVVTSLGTSKDKRTSAQVFWEKFSPEQLENFYAGDEIATRIVDLIPEEALRKWITFKGEGDKKSEYEKISTMLNLRHTVEQTWKWARLYGGGLLYLATDSGDPATPLEEGEKVIGLQDLSRYDVRILNTDVESDFRSPNWGYPNTYYLQVQIGSDYKGYPIHWTRLIRFDGDILPRRTYIRNNYWHDSVLQRLHNVIRNYQTAHDSAAVILQDFNVGVFKMKGLANLIAAGKEDLVKQRIQLINFGKSVLRSMILDDEEEYVDIQRQVSGLGELLKAQGNRLVAATDIPHTKLLGESPDGSNATGNSTTNQWYDHIQSEQTNYLKPKLVQLFQAIFKEEVDFEFNPLWQLDEKEEVNKRNVQANTDALYIQNGVLDPTEIAESRFGGDKYSVETELDEESREGGLITGFEPGDDDTAKPLEEPALSEVGQEDPSELDNTSIFPKTQKWAEPVVMTQMSEPFREPPFDRNLGSGGSRDFNDLARQDEHESTPEVSSIEVLADGKILMGKRRDNGKWTHPGGHSENSETRLEAAFRELEEETGIKPGPHSMRLMSSKVVKGHSGRDVQVHHYRVDLSGLGMTANSLEDPDEEVEKWQFFPLKAIPDEVLNNLHSPEDVILEHHGIVKRKDRSESAIMPRQLQFFKGQNDFNGEAK